MKGLSIKIKIAILASIFILLAVGMFLYGYGILSARNQATADAVAKQRLELEVLDHEQKSFEQGKKDLAQLENSNYPPGELFSNDTNVVNEIQQLEEAAQRYSLDLDISVTGNTKTAVKAPGSAADLYIIPYNITLAGDFSNMLLFMQRAEHMPFVTHATGISVTVEAEDEARVLMSSQFYIKK